MALSNNPGNPAPDDQDSPRPFWWLSGLILGAALFLWQMTEFRTGNASLHWPTTTGTVLESSLTRRSSRYYYSAHIVYSYEINGSRHQSAQIALWSSDLGSGGNDYVTKRFVSNHPVGSEVTVHYDPKDFGNAVLIPGAEGQLNVLLMIPAGSLVMVAIFSVVNGARRRRILKTLLNAPDAQTRTIKMRKGDIEKGQNAMLLNLLIALVFMATAVGLLFLAGRPAMLLETGPPTPSGQPVTAAVHSVLTHPIAATVPCMLGILFFVTRGWRRQRIAQCPVCRNILDKTSVKNARCGDCGTRIIFEDPTSLQFSHPEKHNPVP